MFALTLLPAMALPIDDPILKFLIILVIIFAAPIVLNRFHIPHLLGLIIAGIIIGPHGFNLIARDSSIILSGTAGLLYIMFLSGLDMDMSDFKRSGWRSLIFGLYTFCIPLGLGILAGHYVLGFGIYASILLAGLFASQTLIAYPIVSKLGIARDKSVTITVGGTIITDTLALLQLTIIVGMATGTVDETFWWRLGGSVVACILIIVVLFPLLAHWFFKHYSDSISQYIFVLALVFLAAYMAQIAGLEPIIGAFLAGLALNRLIPRTSPLMNHIEFVGHSIFIPFFLIGVGMLIDYRAFFNDWESIAVAAVMIVLITSAKYLAAYFTQKSFRLSRDQRTVIFGLSSAHVAATLAAVTVGYNVIIGHTPDGEPIRLLSESVLNGTILMILATCTISTFATQRGAHNIAMRNATDDEAKPKREDHLLIPVSNEHTCDKLVNLSIALKRARTHHGLYALYAIDNKLDDPTVEKRGRKLLEQAVSAAAASERYLQSMLRYDVNIANAIASVIRERSITDLVMGIHIEGTPGGTGLGRMVNDVLGKTNVTTWLYHPAQPLSTIRRHLIIVPEKAEKEAGFAQWIEKIHNLAENSSTKIVFYATDATMQYLLPSRKERIAQAEYIVADYFADLASLLREVRRDDCVWVVMSRRDRISYNPAMARVLAFAEHELPENSFVLLYPVQAGETNSWYI